MNHKYIVATMLLSAITLPLFAFAQVKQSPLSTPVPPKKGVPAKAPPVITPAEQEKNSKERITNAFKAAASNLDLLEKSALPISARITLLEEAGANVAAIKTVVGTSMQTIAEAKKITVDSINSVAGFKRSDVEQTKALQESVKKIKLLTKETKASLNQAITLLRAIKIAPADGAPAPQVKK